MIQKLGTTNVVSLGQYKENTLLRKSQQQYSEYLGGLDHSQLENEVNYLLEEYSADVYGKDYFLKGQMVLKEIALRSDGEWSSKISEMERNLGSKIETML